MDLTAMALALAVQAVAEQVTETDLELLEPQILVVAEVAEVLLLRYMVVLMVVQELLFYPYLQPSFQTLMPMRQLQHRDLTLLLHLQLLGHIQHDNY